MDLFKKVNDSIKEVTKHFSSGSIISPRDGVNWYSVLGLENNEITEHDLQVLIDRGFGRTATVYAIVTSIVNYALDIPIKLYDAQPDGWEEIDRGQVYNVVMNPGIYQGHRLTMKEWLEATLTYLLISGNSYLLLDDDIPSIPQGLMRLIPTGVCEPLKDNDPLSRIDGYSIDNYLGGFDVDAERMIHIKYLNPTTYGLETGIGLSPIQAAIYYVYGSLDIAKAVSVMVKNQGIRGIISNESDETLSDEEQKRLQKKFKEKAQGARKFNDLYLSNTKLNYIPMGMNANDLKLIESGTLTNRQICNAYNVPPELFGDPKASTYNNIDTFKKIIYTNSVLPNMTKILDQVNQEWIRRFNTGRTNYKLAYDTSGIEALQSDKKEEAEKDDIVASTILKVLTAPISPEQQRIILEHSLHMSEDEARRFTGNG